MGLSFRKLPDLDSIWEKLCIQSSPFVSPEILNSSKENLPKYKSILSDSLQSLESSPDWVDTTMMRYYLKNRLSLAFYSNYAVQSFWEEMTLDFASLASCFLYSSLLFYRSLSKGLSQFEYFRGNQLDMFQYSRIFSHARIPGEFEDTYVNSTSSTVIISCRGSLYSLPIPSLETINYKLIFNTLQKILSEKEDDSFSLGYFTCLPRAEWKCYRDLLIRFPENLSHLEEIQTSLLFLCLDTDFSLENSSKGFAHLQHGNPANRFFDKSVQLIVSGKYGTGLCVDHNFIDGFTASKFLSHISENWDAFLFDSSAFTDVLPYRKLDWIVDEAILSALEKSKHDYQQESSQKEYLAFSVPIFDPKLLTSFGLGLDSLLQVGIHLALKSFLGTLPSVNEAVLMTHFLKDRYDTAFTTTPEVLDFLVSWEKGKASISDLQNCSLAHKTRLLETKRGESPVFYLTALIISQNPKNEMVNFRGWEKEGVCYTDSPLSSILNVSCTTSSLPSMPFVEGFSFTDTSPGVIGISYIPKIETVDFVLKLDSSYFGMAKELGTLICSTFSRLNDFLFSHS